MYHEPQNIPQFRLNCTITREWHAQTKFYATLRPPPATVLIEQNPPRRPGSFCLVCGFHPYHWRSPHAVSQDSPCHPQGVYHGSARHAEMITQPALSP